ncbi:nitroreductase family deazaflavin-dependent oxidoreductase [bacterium]|nr:nitroreductase family deazaflavin-dependent oxidoreductase [bacterium]
MSQLAESIARARNLRLVARGRKSGQPREVTIWFAVDGEDLVVGTLDERRNWVRNARANPDVEVEVGGIRLRGRFEDVADAGLADRARTALSAKYLTARIAGWFGVRQKHLFAIRDLRAA